MDKEKKVYLQNFNKIWLENLLPEFRLEEPVRKAEFSKMITILSLSLFIFFLLVTLYIIYPIRLLMVLSLPFLLTAIIVPIFMNDTFSDRIKESNIEKVLSCLGSVFYKSKESFFTEAELNDSELFEEFHDSITHYDSFSGIYKGVNFKLAELLISGDGGKTIFKGVVLSFKSNKTINNKTFIANKKDKSIRILGKPYTLKIVFAMLFTFLSISCFCTGFINFGLFCLGFVIWMIHESISEHNKVAKTIKKESMHKLILEDPVFNKKYYAYSSSDVEGRYLITPSFMERFKNLQTVFGTQKVKCAFFQNNIIFAISTGKNLFEIGSLFKPLTNYLTVRKFFNEIMSVYLFIDYFKLNENTKL